MRSGSTGFGAGPGDAHERGRSECAGGLQVGEKYRGREVERTVILPRLVSYLNRSRVEKASCLLETNAVTQEAAGLRRRVCPPPHQPSPAARLLRLPLKGGVMEFYWKPCAGLCAIHSWFTRQTANMVYRVSLLYMVLSISPRGSMGNERECSAGRAEPDRRSTPGFTPADATAQRG